MLENKHLLFDFLSKPNVTEKPQAIIIKRNAQLNANFTTRPNHVHVYLYNVTLYAILSVSRPR